MTGHHDKGKEKVPVSYGDGGGSASEHNNIVISKTGARIKLRGPIQDTWSHGEKYKANGWSCAYCPAKKSSGGKTRFTQHLAGIQGLWWNQYGGQCKELQRLAKLIVSQCTSSSGCERNWSTFALVHSKLRNRLGYEKLDKLVYVHYNLKLAIQQHEADFQSLRDKDADPCSMMMDVALFDENNPIMDWLSNSMSESTPVLDEYDESDDEWTAPGTFLISELQMQPGEVLAFKRKLCFGKNGGNKKVKLAGLYEDEEECFEGDYESDSSHGSPVYDESGDSSSASDEDSDGASDEDSDGDDVKGNGSGGGNTCGEAATTLGDGASGSSSACGVERRRRSGVRIGRPSCSICRRSTRKRYQLLRASLNSKS